MGESDPWGAPAEDDPNIAAARLGDARVFAELYSAHAPVVHAIALARLSPADARDVVQDVFLVAMTRLGELREAGAFGAWLSRIARHRTIDAQRRRRIEVPLRDHTAQYVSPPRAEALAVLDVIRGLPEAYRETLLMRLVEGMTGPEIASKTGLTPGSVRVNLHRGMKLLRRELERSER